ncbi:bifunctional diguanylate cyclase/phosphodiesterase, partial [Geobacter sp.]|uniref:putative bifunctional diguanylate cyclase/phosphodiesterase n=1 Tax=Geobacter sp. TaxID=46610 RepID=UPI0027B9002E
GIESPDRTAAVLAAAKQPLVLKGTLFDMGIAAGIAKGPEHGENADELHMRASMAVSEAERMKTAAPVVYVPSLEATLRSKTQLEGEVKEALANGGFTLFLQPKASLAGMHVTGAEALIRWHHRDKGWVGPADFLGVLEGCGLMRELDNWVIGAALQQIRVLSTQGLNLPVSINLSVHSLTDTGIVSRIREGLRAHDVAPCLLDIEIHEGGVMRDVETSIRVLHGLHELGVGLSIDDFGTGYSSLSYLKRFPIANLKIDQSFIRDMTRDPDDATLVKTIITMAHGLGMKTIAEGVETLEQIDFLCRHQCEEMQGYFFSRPVAAADLGRLLTEGKALDLAPVHVEARERIRVV